MLRVSGEFKSLDWKVEKKGKRVRMVASVRLQVSLPIDTDYLAELEQEQVHVTYTNSGVSTVVEAVADLGKTRPVDSHLLLVSREENQDILITVIHDATNFPPALLEQFAQLTALPETQLSVEIQRHSPQLSLFGDDGEDAEFAEGFK